MYRSFLLHLSPFVGVPINAETKSLVLEGPGFRDAVAEAQVFDHYNHPSDKWDSEGWEPHSPLMATQEAKERVGQLLGKRMYFLFKAIARMLGEGRSVPVYKHSH